MKRIPYLQALNLTFAAIGVFVVGAACWTHDIPGAVAAFAAGCDDISVDPDFSLRSGGVR